LGYWMTKHDFPTPPPSPTLPYITFTQFKSYNCCTMDLRVSVPLSSPSLSPPSLSSPPSQLVRVDQLETRPLLSPPLLPLTSTTILPPEARYNSKDELYSSIQAFAAQHNYAFCIGRSNKINKGPRIKIFYNCDRYGSPPPQNHPHHSLHTRIRNTTTRKTGCQFSIIAVMRNETEWEVRHRPDSIHSVHNHPLSHSISSHPAHRKLSQEEVNQAKCLHNAGKFIMFLLT
jgi:hypothetical protein